MRKLLTTAILLFCPLFGQAQATTGYHRVNQVLARAPQNGVTANIVPYAKVTVTVTSSGVAATIYSDPLLSVLILNSVVTADSSGNYSYYLPLSYCVTEKITALSMGAMTIPNICINGGGGITLPILVNQGGTGATTASGARTNLGAAASGANSDITSLTGILTPLLIAEGGTGGGSASAARTNLGAAANGANSDITSLLGITTPLPVTEGGTGASLAPNALSNLGAAALAGANFTGTVSAPGLFSTAVGCNGGTPYMEYNGACGPGGSAASLPFSAITTGSNTTAAMTVGSGGSMGPTGTGTINANVLDATPFCSGFSPSNAQYYQYTTGGTPDPCITTSAPPGSGNTTSTSLTTHFLPEANGANSIINSPFFDGNPGSTPTKLAGASGLTLAADATYTDWISMLGNTTVLSLVTHSFNLFAPSSTSFTAYGLQFSATAPSVAGIVHVGAPSSAVSQVTYSLIVPTDLATQGADTMLANMTAGTAQPTAVAIPTTAHGVWLGQGTATPPGITAAGAVDTVLLGQGASADPLFGAVTSAYVDSSVVVDNGNTTTTGNKVAISTSTAGKINFIDYPSPYAIPSANCVGGSGGSAWSTTLVASCRLGTYNQGGYLPFADTNTGQFEIELPADWDTAVNPYINLLFTTGTNVSGTIIFNAAVSCYSTNNSGADDQAFQTAQTFGTITAASTNFGNSVTLQFNNTSMTGCSAGGGMIVKITRATDTAASVVPVTRAIVTVPRRIAVQAE